MFGPVSWNGPGGRLLTLVMRVSGPTLTDRPVPPVPNRNWSAGGRPGSPPGMLRMGRPVAVWTPPRSGAGSVEYKDFLEDGALMKKLAPFGADVT